MKYGHCLVIFLGIVFQSCVTPKISSSTICAVIDVAAGDLSKQDSVAKITAIDKFYNWDVATDLEFKIDKGLPGSEWPQNEEERQKRLHSHMSDPYPMIYLYAYPIADTIFKSKDRTFIKKQVKAKKESTINCRSNKMDILSLQKSNFSTYIFYKPLFSKNLRYAVIRVSQAFSKTSDNKTIGGSLQTLYYRYTEEKGWVLLFAGPICS